MKDFIAALFEGELLIVKLNYLVPADTSLQILLVLFHPQCNRGEFVLLIRFAEFRDIS